MAKSSQQIAEERGWKIRTICRETAPYTSYVNFTDFDRRLKAVGTHIQSILANTPYGISGAEDYSKNPREGNILGIFSIYVPTHNQKGLLSLLDVGNVQVFTNGEFGLHVAKDATLQKKLRDATARKKVTNEGEIVNKG